MKTPRHGMTLIELTVSLLILGVAMAALLQLVTLAGRLRRQLTERRVALREVANQAERIALLSWDDTAPEKLTAWQPSDELSAALPAAKCGITASEEPGVPRGRRIRLEVAWTNAAAQPVEPVSLTVWRFAAEERP